MSDHYFKKIIKDSSADKDKQNYYEEKEENEMSYKNKKHEDDCDKKCKHEDDCDKKCKHESDCDKKCKHKEEKGIFTEFDVSETSPLSFTPTTGTTGTLASLNILDKVKIDVDDPDDEVLLQGTVEWIPNRISLVADILTAILLFLLGGAGTFTLPLSVQATFRIWKSEGHGHGQGQLIPIFETTDTSSIAALDLLLPAIVFGPTTTSFHFVDQNPSCGINTYYSTIDVSVFATGGLDLTGGGVLTPILDILFPSGVVGFTTETHVLTAAEIEDED